MKRQTDTPYQRLHPKQPKPEGFEILSRESKTLGWRHVPRKQVWSGGKGTYVNLGDPTGDYMEAYRVGTRASARYETNVAKAAALRGKTTLKEWGLEWLESRKGKVKPKTYKAHEQRLRLWVFPEANGICLGEITLEDLSAVHVRRWLDKLPTDTLQYNSRRDILATLKACLYAAVADGALAENPAKDVHISSQLSRSLRKAEDETKDVRYWPEDESPILLRASEGTSVDALVALGMLAGLRPGEVNGLAWTDIDFLGHTIHVHRADRGSDSTKTGESRTIHVDAEVIRRLAAVQDRQTERREAPVRPDRPRVRPIPVDWVMTISYKFQGDALKKLCRRLGVQVLPPHSLRHTFATQSLAAGESPADLAEHLGHSIAVLTKTYLHSDKNRLKGVSSRVVQMLLRPTLSVVEQVEASQPAPINPYHGATEAGSPASVLAAQIDRSPAVPSSN